MTTVPNPLHFRTSAEVSPHPGRDVSEERGRFSDNPRQVPPDREAVDRFLAYSRSRPDWRDRWRRLFYPDRFPHEAVTPPPPNPVAPSRTGPNHPGAYP